jgi:para-nitrobenzyl esterase
VSDLLSLVTPGTAQIYLGPNPIRDGVVLPQAPVEEVFRSGQWNRVPVIIGTNRDEVTTFLAEKPEHARLLFGKIPVLRDRRRYRKEVSYQARLWRVAGVDSIADAMLEGAHKDVWTYRFDWDEAPRIPVVRPDILLGAAHGMEMSFAFGDLNAEFDIFNVATRFNRPGRVALTNDMVQIWSSFVAGELPEEKTAGLWRRRAAATDAPDSLIFDSLKDGGLRMACLRDSIANIKAELATDTELSNEDQCCIYARCFMWSSLFVEDNAANEYAKWAADRGLGLQPEQFRPVDEI